MKKRNILVMLLCIISMLYGLSGTYPYAAAKSRSGYKRKELELYRKDKNGERVSVASERMRLNYNKKDKLCVLYSQSYYLSSGDEVYKEYIRSWSSKGKASDRMQKFDKKIESIPYLGDAKISDNGTIFAIRWNWINSNDKRKMRPMVRLNVFNRKGKMMSNLRLDKATSFFDPGPLNSVGERSDFYEINDFEINGKYIDIIFARTDDEDFDESGRYSLQRFNWKTGELVSCFELLRPCQRLCEGYPYGTDMNSFYKYSKDGSKCLWESTLPKGKAGIRRRLRYYIKQDYDVIKGKLFYSNINGVYMLDTQENNSIPKKLITVKDCPELGQGLTSVMDLVAVNENHFYLLITYEVGGAADILYQYRKKND
ncbi:MAG: hypothetical protein HFH14_01935 [Lachnospiraceae bacterium]|nr:hypothetical protein [Lachnospiraceae bacterium]